MGTRFKRLGASERLVASLLGWQPQPPRHRAKTRLSYRDLALEELEDRRLLAINVGVVGNTLRITGDQDNLNLLDMVTLTPVGMNQVEVFDAGLSRGIFTRGANAGEYQRVEISVGAANDIVKINGPTAITDSGQLLIFGGFGDDTLTGDVGGEVFIGGEGDDVMTGERGDDYYIFEPALGAQIDTVVEQPIPEYGVDTLDFSGLQVGDPVVVDLTDNMTMAQHATGGMNRIVTTTGGSPLGLEDIIGGFANDTLTGNKWANRITGNDGSDIMYGQEGSDTYFFGPALALPMAMGAQQDVVKETHDPNPPEDLGIDTLDFSLLGITDPVIVDLRNDSPALLAQHTNRDVRTSAAGESIKLEHVIGGAASDSLVGNASKNRLEGRGGNDVLDGDDGDDVLIGGDGGDSIAGGDADDVLEGSDGDDRLVGGPGDDTYLFGSLFTDELDIVAELPDEGSDTLDFSAATLELAIELNLDVPIATNGLGRVHTDQGGQAANFENAVGGSAGDQIIGNDADNSLAGGGGNDALDGHGGADLLYGEGGNDRLFGDADDDYLSGGEGNDELNGGEGDDELEGRAGSDTYVFGPAVVMQLDTIVEISPLVDDLDTLDFQDLAADDPVRVDLTDGFELAFHTNRVVYTEEPEQAENLENIIGGAGNDILKGNLRRNRIEGRGGSDQLEGLEHDDLLEGGDGGDTILGGLHDDTLVGGGGNDSMDGQGGNDVYLFASTPAFEIDLLTEALDGGVDRLDFNPLPGTEPVAVNLAGTFLLLASHQNRTVFANSFGLANFFENVTGGAGDDSISGNDSQNLLAGGPGNDRYVFGTLPTQPHTDTISELAGGGVDTLDFSLLAAHQPVTVDLALSANLAQYSNQTIQTPMGQAEQLENAIGGAGNDVLRGNSASNRLEGRAGADILNGRGGDDHELGGAGDDQYQFDPPTAAENDTVAELVNEGLDLLEFSALAVAITADLTRSVPALLASHAMRTVVTAAAGQALNFERVFGGAADDDLRGNGGDNWLQGGPGNDRLEGRGGSDRYLFGPGNGPGSLGSDQVIEAQGCLDNDVLDFLAMTSPIIVDLGQAAPQTVDLGGELELTLSRATAIERADVSPIFQTHVVQRNGCQQPVWQPAGPTGVVGGQVEGIANQPVAGAVHAIALDPTNSSIAYIGTVNGGVWKTTNALAANPTWRPISDGFPLSIGALDIDPANPHAIVAGIGRFSAAGRDGGRLPGILKSSDGGSSWQLLSAGINGQNVAAVAIRGDTILVAGSNAAGPGIVGGLFRSTNGGASFSPITGPTGLPAGNVSDLQADPGNPAVFYAAVLGVGIFRSNNTGDTWSPVSDANVTAVVGATTNNMEIAVHNNPAAGTMAVYLAVMNNGQLAGLFRSPLGAPISGATMATPIVITSSNHGLVTGATVSIAGVAGNTMANGNFTVTRVDDNRFSLDGSAGNAAYGGGGVWTLTSNLWNRMDAPRTNEGGGAVGLQPREKPGSQGAVHFSITADPRNPHLVYVGGDRQPGNMGVPPNDFFTGANSIGATNYTGRLFRGDARIAPTGAVPSPQWTPLTHNGTTSNSAPHADSRDMVAIPVNGPGGPETLIIEVDDGGVYRRVNASNSAAVNAAAPDWNSANGDLQITEFYSIEYDTTAVKPDGTNSGVVLGGTQDIGTIEQSIAGGTQFRTVSQGDGTIVQVDDSATPSQRFSSNPSLGGFRQQTVNAANVVTANAFPPLTVNGTGGTRGVDTFFDNTLPFLTPWELNRVAPTRYLFGSRYLLEFNPATGLVNVQGSAAGNATPANNVVNLTADGLDNDGDGVIDDADEFQVNSTVANPVFNAAPNARRYTAIAYGGRRNNVNAPNVAYVGANTGQLWLRQAVTAPNGQLSDFVQVAYPGGAGSFGGLIQDIVMDPDDWRTAYVVTRFPTRIWRTTDGGATAANWTNISPPAAVGPAGTLDIRSIEIVAQRNSKAIVIGGLGGIFQTVVNPNINIPNSWRRMGDNVPAEVLLRDIRYDPVDDMLVLGSLGRGAYLLPMYHGDNVPPAVQQVLVNNATAWTNDFRTYLNANGLGNGGYAIPVGSGAAQLRPLPWTNVNQIKVVFSKDVSVDLAALSLTGVNRANYALMAFAYDAATFTATWTVQAALDSDRLQLKLNAEAAGAIRDTRGNVLDGEWINPANETAAMGSRFNSGNGIAGSDFVFNFSVLPGDVTESTLAVTVADVGYTRARMGTTTAAPGVAPNTYIQFADVNGSAAIDADDVALVRARVGNRLPAPPGPRAFEIDAADEASSLIAFRRTSAPADGKYRELMERLSSTPLASPSAIFAPLATRLGQGDFSWTPTQRRWNLEDIDDIFASDSSENWMGPWPERFNSLHTDQSFDLS